MKPMISSLFLVMALLLGGMSVALAVEPDEVLADPALEGRARELSQELRCLVCQNQSIDDSHAELAKDLRVIVRERLVEGDSNQQVLDFIVARYGDYVLLRPPVKPGTYALWFGPGAILLIAATGIFFWMRRQSQEAVAQADIPAEQVSGLSEAEQARLAALMREDDAAGPDPAVGDRKG